LVKLLIGDSVVYGSHGLGRIVAREERAVLGAKQEILVLELPDGLSVTLSVAQARAVVRQPLSEADLVEVQETLREDQPLSEEGWLQRRRATTAKLTGDPLALAEVIRDGARRQQRLMLKRPPSQLSPGEKDAYLQARRRLSEEIALARGSDVDDADAWIDQQLVGST
jgi:CarD family transcriptional regulator